MHCQELIFLFLLLTTIVASLPKNYNQRQDGKLNVHAKLENLLFVIAPSTSDTSSSSSSGIDFALPGLLEDTLDFRKTLKERITSNNNKDGEEKKSIDVENEFKTPRNIKNIKDKKKLTESKLIGDSIDNCGPARFRDRFGVCQYDDNESLKN